MGFLAKLRARFRKQEPVHPAEHIERPVEQVNTSKGLNVRDLKYAESMGKWDVLTASIRKIHENTTVLVERIPETVLTERNFGFWINKVFNKLNTLEGFVEQLNTLPEEKRGEVLKKVEFIVDETARDVREMNVIWFLDWRGRSTAKEVGFVLDLSRSRTNQILKDLERQEVLRAEREGKTVYFYIRKRQ